MELRATTRQLYLPFDLLHSKLREENRLRVVRKFIPLAKARGPLSAVLVEELLRDEGATDISIARTQQEQKAQWEARHHLYWAIVNAHPGHTFVITDAAVPLARLPELIGYAQQLLAEMDIQGSIIGHVGDGNFHTVIAVKPGDYDRVQTFSERLVRQALAWDGTASGEHGIGLVKRGFMVEEHGASLAWMHRLKALFDPDGLLNPGKLL